MALVYPPIKRPVVLLEAAPINLRPTVRSPKSIASPVEAIVTYWMTFVEELPPAEIPLVGEANPEFWFRVVSKSPKSRAFPVVAIVMY